MGLENSTNDIPCIQCNLSIASTKSKKGSNLAKSVANFLRSVTRQRLWNKPKPAAMTRSRSLLSDAQPTERESESKYDDNNEKSPLITGRRATTAITSPYPKRKPIERKPRST